MTQSQNNPRGIVFILLGMATFSIQDALIKFIYEDVALYELYFGRTLVACILLIIYLKITNQKINLKSHYPFLTILRVICFFFGFSFFYISLTYMSLAMANALFFSSPFFISILATIFLKEKVGIRRWIAIFAGFFGVYIVLNPDFNDFDYMKLAPVACALCYAISMTITKVTSDKDNVYTQTFAFYIGAIIISSIFYFIIGDGQFNTSNHPASQFIFRKWFVDLENSIILMITTGITATLAFLLLFSAYSIASPSVVSPFEYSILLWSSLIGYVYFDEIPSLTTFIGILIIVSSGIYIFIREKAQDQSIVTEKPLR